MLQPELKIWKIQIVYTKYAIIKFAYYNKHKIIELNFINTGGLGLEKCTVIYFLFHSNNKYYIKMAYV